MMDKVSTNIKITIPLMAKVSMDIYNTNLF